MTQAIELNFSITGKKRFSFERTSIKTHSKLFDHHRIMFIDYFPHDFSVKYLMMSAIGCFMIKYSRKLGNNHVEQVVIK